MKTNSDFKIIFQDFLKDFYVIGHSLGIFIYLMFHREFRASLLKVFCKVKKINEKILINVLVSIVLTIAYLLKKETNASRSTGRDGVQFQSSCRTVQNSL